LTALERGTLSPTRQGEAGVIYAKKLSNAETRIDWKKSSAEVHNHIRGLSPFPGAWFEAGGVRVKALRSTAGEGQGAPGSVLDDGLTIACGEGAIRLTQVQKAGARAMPAEEFLRGAALKAGTKVS
jgi:methionyl-tRNA formyltransferase